MRSPTPDSNITEPAPSYTKSSDELIMVEKHHELALRPRHQPPAGNRAGLEVHPVPGNNAFIVSVLPPEVPIYGVKRATCDIVLVIDVSGSMSAAAPMPDVPEGTDREAAGLSVLDLVKHAARTILETLQSGDRLGIVTFSDDATVSSKFSTFLELSAPF
jgi:hypothetical protein